MRKLLIFCCCLLLILTCLPAGMAATISGRGYEDFELCYADNLDFINQNTGRHLLPLVLAKGEANADGGHRMYELLGDVLRVTIRLVVFKFVDPAGELSVAFDFLQIGRAHV